MSERLESNEFFEEMILLTPLQYEKFKEWRRQEPTSDLQVGSGFIDSEAMDSGRKRHKGETNITDDVNPDMAKKKRIYLMATNNVEAIVQFNRVLALQRNLDEHFTEGKQLLAGYTVARISREIAKLKKKYGTEFNEILRGQTSRGTTGSTKPTAETLTASPVGTDTEELEDIEDEIEDEIDDDLPYDTSWIDQQWKLSDFDSEDEIDFPTSTAPSTSKYKGKTPQLKTIKGNKGKKKLFTEQKGSGLLFRNDKFWDNV